MFESQKMKVASFGSPLFDVLQIYSRGGSKALYNVYRNTQQCFI